MRKFIILLSITALLIIGLLYVDYSLQSKKHSNNNPAPNNTKQPESDIVSASEGKNQAIKKIPILMYHAIDYGPNSLYVSKDDFASHIEYLIKKSYNFITFEDLYNNNIPNNPIILTFDDGYKSIYTNAYPILSENQIKATVFIINESIGNKLYLNKEEISNMNTLISFQCHTLSHPDLTSLDDESLDNELKLSKYNLQKIVTNKVLALSYPGGKYDNRVFNNADQYYEYAVTTNNGIYNLKDSKLKIPRIRIAKGDKAGDIDNMLNK